MVSDGRTVRFTQVLDEQTREFEREFLARPGVELPLLQRQLWIAARGGEFFLLQIRASDGAPAMQVVVDVQRTSRLASFPHGRVLRMGRAVDEEQELWGLRCLRELCLRHTELISLTLQGLCPTRAELEEFRQLTAAAGFTPLTAPLEYLRTLRLDFPHGPRAALAALPQKTRAKIRQADRCGERRAITDPRYIPQCRAAVNASRSRTGTGPSGFDFETAFKLAAQHPDRVRIVACFMPHRPDTVLAYVIGYRHGEMAEYVSAGSLYDANLRRTPFNYALIWELVTWAHAGGARWIDLGGITDGRAGDPIATISEFKRHLSRTEVELHHEAGTCLRQVRAHTLGLVARCAAAAAALAAIVESITPTRG